MDLTGDENLCFLGETLKYAMTNRPHGAIREMRGAVARNSHIRIPERAKALQSVGATDFGAQNGEG